MTLPPLALSVRQPWAWAIIHAGKDIENRSWRHPNPGLKFRGPVCIHAASGMTRDEYEGCIPLPPRSANGCFGDSMPDGSFHPPPARDLVRGAIIGVIDVVDVVRESSSPWWMGPVGLVLANPRAIEPIPCKGQLGFFRWERGGELALPAKWMLPPIPKAQPVTTPEVDLFWKE